MKYNIDYFIKKFEAIPDSKWTTGNYTDGYGVCCAIGHCGITTSGERNNEADALHDIFFRTIGYRAATINDGLLDSRQLAENPKERILNALYLANAIEEYGF